MVDRTAVFCYSITMNGTVTKKHFFIIWKEFGFKKAVKILKSKEPVALMVLMGD
jgi:hypothetical protein